MRRSRIPGVATRRTSRTINQQVVLNLLLAQQPISRVQLARRLGMQRSAVSRIVQDLIDAGLVREGLAGEGERGRKPTLLHLDSRGRCAVAVDVRPTRTFVVLTDLVGHELSPVRSFVTEREPRQFLFHLSTEVLRVLSEHPEAGRCHGVGVAFPGMLDKAGSTVVHAPALGWRNVPLKAPLAEALSLPVEMENAAKACALAQIWKARDDNPTGGLVFVSVSDGVGVGLVVGGEILREWESLQSPFEVDKWLLPLPLWAKRPYDDSGIKAWQVLQGDMRQGHSDNAMCIYLHIPFCSSKCGFCDSYSFKLGSHTQEHIDKYLERLCAEIDLWSGQGNLSQRRISTVHMGGGTPTFIGEAGLHRITNHLREHFQTNDSTEWALESTVDALTPSMIKVMHDLGYRRLHVGVQSLEDEVRRIIGRRCVSKDVLQVIEITLALGWVVSVDLICGLPSQTLDGFLTGIQDLIDIGVNGFSIYELLIYPQNRRWAEAHGLTNISHIPNYFLFPPP